MADGSSIEWTDATWSPVVGCTRVSAGCDNCYAVRQTRRLAAFGQAKYQGLVNEGKGHFNGVARLHRPSLGLPLGWRRGRRIFVNPMSDLFHEGISFEEIAAVFGVMAGTPQHTFQVLTKRPQRALEWFRWLSLMAPAREAVRCLVLALTRGVEASKIYRGTDRLPVWPLPNVWLGVSVEDQQTADERIPVLLQCPAAVRFVSYEPALGPVDFKRFMPRPLFHCSECGKEKFRDDCRRCGTFDNPASNEICGLDWIIVGGESGPGARPFDVAWARETVRQCREAGVACFVKQLCARPTLGAAQTWGGGGDVVVHHPGPDEIRLHHPKGGDPDEWPADLRVRDLPRSQEPPA